MALVLKLLSALVAALPTFLDWLSKRQAAQAREEVLERVNTVRDNPANAWMQRFGKSKPESDGGSTASNKTSAP